MCTHTQNIRLNPVMSCDTTWIRDCVTYISHPVPSIGISTKVLWYTVYPTQFAWESMHP